ncbi:MAG: cell division ATP-binding protein FtsE [Candidatus Aminicenantes bacterium]
MIEFYHIYKQYVSDQYALSDVSFSVEKGEFIFLTGASGAGKTTLLKLIFKEELPSRGQILIDSININLISHKLLYQLRRSIGIVFQDFRLLENRTVYENVAIPLVVRGEKRSIIDKKVMNALSMVGLTHRRNYVPTHISGGEQQRVAIARAIVGNPKIILADEPTGNLDTELSIEIFRILERINANGITVLVATHDNHLLDLFPKRILKLEKGRIVSDGKIGGGQ